MMKRTLQVLCLLAVLMLTSCRTRKAMVYLQDMDELHEYPVTQKYEAVIRRDDKLKIIVSSKKPELALPFNIPGTGGYTVEPDGTVKTTSSQLNGTGENAPGYIVDVNGEIDFPILGKLQVEGLSRNQLIELIKSRLIDDGLLLDPIVLVEFLNFRFTVLGEVGSKGLYSIPGDRITIFEAIAKAGDLKETSRVDRVRVIREYGNKRRELDVDLRSKDVFLSPAYYLQQNDIVYVEPNSTKVAEDSRRRMSSWSLGFSIITSLTSFVLLFVKLK